MNTDKRNHKLAVQPPLWLKHEIEETCQYTTTKGERDKTKRIRKGKLYYFII